MKTFPMSIQMRKMMRKMQTTKATWVASLYQIKARVTKRVVVMENLPFLKQNEPQSRNAQSESEWPQRPPPHYMQDDEPRDVATAPKADVFESLKGNPMALVLLGIIIGALLVNMRPVVIKS
jgi:hypothetical protein